ncbi:hypothetical protein AB0N20_31000 [Streptomyces griseoincarnatus]
MTDRTLTPGPNGAITDDIRDHGYAILQTRVERIPRLIKGLPCQEPDGCTAPATLATLAIEAVSVEDSHTCITLAKDEAGLPIVIVVCDEHRHEASHDLYSRLTDQERPDGIRAFDAIGQYLNWT